MSDLTKNLLSLLRKDGYLLYITCSVFEKENEHVVNEEEAMEEDFTDLDDELLEDLDLEINELAKEETVTAAVGSLATK